MMSQTVTDQQSIIIKGNIFSNFLNSALKSKTNTHISCNEIIILTFSGAKGNYIPGRRPRGLIASTRYIISYSSLKGENNYYILFINQAASHSFSLNSTEKPRHKFLLLQKDCQFQSKKVFF